MCCLEYQFKYKTKLWLLVASQHTNVIKYTHKHYVNYRQHEYTTRQDHDHDIRREEALYRPPPLYINKTSYNNIIRISEQNIYLFLASFQRFVWLSQYHSTVINIDRIEEKSDKIYNHLEESSHFLETTENLLPDPLEHL